MPFLWGPILRKMLQDNFIQRRKKSGGQLYEMPRPYQKVTNYENKLSESGFVYLLRRIGVLLGRRKNELLILDKIIKNLIICIQSLDKIIDHSAKEKKIDGAASLIMSLVKALKLVESSFGRAATSEVSKILDQYIPRMAQAFKEESNILDKVNHAAFPEDSDLVVMQEKRNLDLLLYSEIYFKLLELPTRLRSTILKNLRCFGVIDITIDDLLDLDEDLALGNYNIFLIELAKHVQSKGYLDVSYKEARKLIRETGVMRQVYELLPKYRNALKMGQLPAKLRAYLTRIINERYILFDKQLRPTFQTDGENFK